MPWTPDLSQFALKSTTPQYVADTRMHVADVLASFPAQASRRGMLATVDDLYGALDGSLVCGTDGTRYFWRPNGLPEYINGIVYPGQGDMTITALQHPTIIKGTGTLGIGVNRKITLDTANVWPGARKHFDMSGVTSILGGLQILSGVSVVLSILAGQRYDMAVDYSSGSAAWVQV